MQILWKPSDSKKTSSRGSCQTTRAKRHSQCMCNEEGKASALRLLQASKVRDENHNEEGTKKEEQYHLE